MNKSFLIDFNNSDKFQKSENMSNELILNKNDNDVLIDLFEIIKDSIDDIDIDDIDIDKQEQFEDTYNVKATFNLYEPNGIYGNYNDIYILMDIELYYEKSYEEYGTDIASINYIDGEIIDMCTNSFNILDDKKELIFNTLNPTSDLLKKYGDDFLELIEYRLKEFLNQNESLLFESQTYNFNKALIDFDQNRQGGFEKSKIDSNNDIINKHIYNFNNCKIGDPIYIDDTFGVNTYNGTLLGYYAFDSDIDLKPVFIYKTELANKFNHFDAVRYTKLFRGKVADFYLPNTLEFVTGITNLKNVGIDDIIYGSHRYWTSDDTNQLYGNYVINNLSNNKLTIGSIRKTNKLYIIPFFTIKD